MKNSSVPTTDGNDLKGVIKMGDNEEQPYSQREPEQQQPNLAPKRPLVPPEFRNLNTLDEPVCETIVIDFLCHPNLSV